MKEKIIIIGLVLSAVLLSWNVSGVYHTEKDAMKRSEALKQGYELGKAGVCDDMSYNLAMVYCQ